RHRWTISGLLQTILPEFTRATNISVKILAQGTGEALDTARRDAADLVLVHDPEAEAKFGSLHGTIRWPQGRSRPYRRRPRRGRRARGHRPCRGTLCFAR